MYSVTPLHSRNVTTLTSEDHHHHHYVQYNYQTTSSHQAPHTHQGESSCERQPEQSVVLSQYVVVVLREREGNQGNSETRISDVFSVINPDNTFNILNQVSVVSDQSYYNSQDSQPVLL